MGKLCRHYHISLQSGCDATLERMNRKYTTGQYRQIVDRLRQAISDVAITTDIMTGFPGETDEEFESTLAFVKDIGFLEYMYLSIHLGRGHLQPPIQSS